jgi:hypothetical protein
MPPSAASRPKYNPSRKAPFVVWATLSFALEYATGRPPCSIDAVPTLSAIADANHESLLIRFSPDLLPELNVQVD